MAYLIDHLPISVPVGTRDFTAVDIDDSYTTVKLILARKTTASPTFWADGVHVNLDSWCSLDGGVTWLEWLGFGAEGGNLLEHPESTVSSALPSGTGRKMKFRVTVSGGTLVSQLTVETT